MFADLNSMGMEVVDEIYPGFTDIINYICKNHSDQNNDLFIERELIIIFFGVFMNNLKHIPPGFCICICEIIMQLTVSDSATLNSILEDIVQKFRETLLKKAPQLIKNDESCAVYG